MKLSFKAFLIIATLFCITVQEFSIEQAEAGVVVRRRIRSRFKHKPRKNTVALRATLGKIDGGDAYGSIKSMRKVYAARLKEYKVSLRTWQKEKKLAEKLEKQYAKEQEKKAKVDAKMRAEYAKKLAKIKQRQQVEITQTKEAEVSEDKKSATDKSKDGEKDTKKSKSIFSKLTEKADSAQKTVTQTKTGFKKDKLKFMSRLFLSLFGKE